MENEIRENQAAQVARDERSAKQVALAKKRGWGQKDAPASPGVQTEEDEEEYPGRSPNHSFYIDLKGENRLGEDQHPHAAGAARTSINKNYPEPGEGSSGTGPFPPEYDTSTIDRRDEGNKRERELERE
jgi:hypothetical protein